MASCALEVESMELYRTLFGLGDENLRLIMRETQTRIALDGQQLRIEGDGQAVDLARSVLEALLDLLRRHEAVDSITIRYALSLAREGRLEQLQELQGDTLLQTYKGVKIHAKTLQQQNYVDAIRSHLLVFGVGPAGTGKTYLAIAMAVSALKRKEVERIVLTRPAVEAGEKLGFLPGDLSAKVDPYLRPLLDALTEMVGQEGCQRLFERGAVEIAPLAYMRGRTLSDAFVILDEAQNTTREQMKMFLTRFGARSRMVVNGDTTQIDLPFGRGSGLVEALEVLADTPSAAVIRLTRRDVVRHDLVLEIVAAYERHAGRRAQGEADRPDVLEEALHVQEKEADR